MTIGTSSPSASPVKQIETRLGWMYFILRDGVLQIVSTVFEAKGTCLLRDKWQKRQCIELLTIHQYRQIIAMSGHTRLYTYSQLSSCR